MKITTLGIWGGYPKANSATSSFLIEHDGFHCLFDCGSGVLASLQNYIALDSLDAVVISHYHADHIADIGSLQYSRLIQYYLGHPSPPLPIYGHTLDEEQFTKLSYKEQTTAIELAAHQPITIGPFTVTACPTVHPVYCLALKFTVGNQSAVFTADTEWTDALIPFATDADILFSEANLYEEHIGISPGHLAGSQAGTLAEQAGVKQLILTHLPHHGEIQDILHEAKKTFAGPVELAEAGKVYTL
ncbi:MBL fold metallo-hydrolase [Sporosarcina sp. PTS2304]|uniref:MBL fold metallo-hydrolase n=1 Tax=Sporosarcina sp. PTS2304 TaxID=2283194 RepID=UPI000E0D07B5|nr:MBL fold metallo-hydrolase [Sporosarcina sp. PTS2304]AXI00874.1 MBL fold metallo-hydrolase [Sporosarcina sp. PTS2304]